MAHCPVCNTPLNDDFGLVDCSQCGTGLFIEFDGSVKRREEGQSTASSPRAMRVDIPEAEIPPPIERSSPSYQRLISEEKPSHSESSDSLSSEAEMDFTQAPEVLIPEADPPAESLSDLADFANSEQSSAREGAYTYQLLISGVDTSDLRNAVKEALTDPLFLWDVEGLLKGLTNGDLQLTELTPVKASLVVQRLGTLPLQISWVQHALVEP